MYYIIIKHQKMSKKRVKIGLSPEGYGKDDLCKENEECQNSNCQKYHPKWAFGVCITHL